MERKEELRWAALACLETICASEGARDADRIAAAKLLLEHLDSGAEAGGITIVMEGVPKEFLA